MESSASTVERETETSSSVLLKRKSGELWSPFPVGSLHHLYRCQWCLTSSSSLCCWETFTLNWQKSMASRTGALIWFLLLQPLSLEPSWVWFWSSSLTASIRTKLLRKRLEMGQPERRMMIFHRSQWVLTPGCHRPRIKWQITFYLFLRTRMKRTLSMKRAANRML